MGETTIEQGFLDEIVAERSVRNPGFPQLVEEATQRRKRLRELAAIRAAAAVSQTMVAARMGTSQSVVARIESGDVDTKLSTLERYAAAVERRLRWEMVASGSDLGAPETEVPGVQDQDVVARPFGVGLVSEVGLHPPGRGSRGSAASLAVRRRAPARYGFRDEADATARSATERVVERLPRGSEKGPLAKSWLAATG